MGFSDFRRFARARTRRGLEQIVRRAGNDLVRKNYYSPLPDIPQLSESLWGRPASTPGVNLRVDAGAELLRSLQPFVAEFSPPLERQEGDGFFLRNDSYESVDAEVLYAIVRHVKPSRLIELGSGASSHVIAAARQANVAAGRGFEYEIIDPYPFTAGAADAMGPVLGAHIHQQRVENVESEQLVTSLRSGDILFVDTSHTVKTGGDVTHVFLQLLPRLSPGVWVHIHDIFLPYEYPREWVVDRRYAWAEQYLLHAFLAFNDRFEVVLPTFAVRCMFPDIVAEIVPSFEPSVKPGAFWMKSVSNPPV